MGKALRVMAPVQHILPCSAVFATWRAFQHPAQLEPESIAAFGSAHIHPNRRKGHVAGSNKVCAACRCHACNACRTDANDMLYLRSSTHLLHKTPRSKGAMHFHTQHTIHTPRWLVKPGQLKAYRHQNYQEPVCTKVQATHSSFRWHQQTGTRCHKASATPQQTDTATGKADCRQHMCCFRRLSYLRTTPTVGVPVCTTRAGTSPALRP